MRWVQLCGSLNILWHCFSLVLEWNFSSPVDPDNHDGVITHLEPGILECEVKWALASITANKASRGDRIPVELFQNLEDNDVKVRHSLWLFWFMVILFKCQRSWRLRLGDWDILSSWVLGTSSEVDSLQETLICDRGVLLCLPWTIFKYTIFLVVALGITMNVYNCSGNLWETFCHFRWNIELLFPFK